MECCCNIRLPTPADVVPHNGARSYLMAASKIPLPEKSRRLRAHGMLARAVGTLTPFALIAAITTSSCKLATGDLSITPDTAVNVVVLGYTTTTSAPNVEDVAVHFYNKGGAGSYIVEFWSSRASPSEAHRFWGSPPPASVRAGYDAFLVFHVPVASSAHVEWVIVRSRATDSDALRETSCFRPGGGTCPPP